MTTGLTRNQKRKISSLELSRGHLKKEIYMSNQVFEVFELNTSASERVLANSPKVLRALEEFRDSALGDLTDTAVRLSGKWKGLRTHLAISVKKAVGISAKYEELKNKVLELSDDVDEKNEQISTLNSLVTDLSAEKIQQANEIAEKNILVTQLEANNAKLRENLDEFSKLSNIMQRFGIIPSKLRNLLCDYADRRDQNYGPEPKKE
jgi:chromosome segregation ATPase